MVGGKCCCKAALPPPYFLSLKKLLMKKFILSLMITAVCATIAINTKAQTGYTYQVHSPDTSLNASSISATVLGIPSNTLSISAKLVKLSGTLPNTGSWAINGAYTLLQYSNTNSDWHDLNTDTLKCLNQATNEKTWAITQTSYNSYRVLTVIPSGTVTTTAYLIYCRRPDENKH